MSSRHPAAPEASPPSVSGRSSRLKGADGAAARPDCVRPLTRETSTARGAPKRGAGRKERLHPPTGGPPFTSCAAGAADHLLRSNKMNETTLTIIGNLTEAPELRYLPSGAARAGFTVASTPRR